MSEKTNLFSDHIEILRRMNQKKLDEKDVEIAALKKEVIRLKDLLENNDWYKAYEKLDRAVEDARTSLRLARH